MGGKEEEETDGKKREKGGRRAYIYLFYCSRVVDSADHSNSAFQSTLNCLPYTVMLLDGWDLHPEAKTKVVTYPGHDRDQITALMKDRKIWRSIASLEIFFLRPQKSHFGVKALTSVVRMICFNDVLTGDFMGPLQASVPSHLAKQMFRGVSRSVRGSQGASGPT